MARRYHEIKGLAEFTAKTIVSDEEQSLCYVPWTHQLHLPHSMKTVAVWLAKRSDLFHQSSRKNPLPEAAKLR